MSKTFITTTQLKNYLESACEKAVETACNRLLGTLQELIMSEYYDEYNPIKYVRTYQFYSSAITRMLSKTCGEILMDSTRMQYGNDWSGELQLLYASEGYHGGINIQTDGLFWVTFVEFCNKNAVEILKEELRKNGISVR